jgi:hypothetical protein
MSISFDKNQVIIWKAESVVPEHSLQWNTLTEKNILLIVPI